MPFPAVFFDRDGVLNDAIIRDGKPYPPTTVSEFVIKSDARTVLSQLKAQGFLIFVITNQPDIARATTTSAAVDVLNDRLKAALPIDEIFVCPHDDVDNCDCRKPKPGLIVRAAKKYHVDLQRSFVVGDRWRDIEAGRTAGCKTIWIDCGYNEKKPEQYDDVTTSLSGVFNFIMEN